MTVQNCTVDLEADCGGTYAGIAVKLSGSANSIQGVTVRGSAKTDKVRGLADTLEGGTGSDCSGGLCEKHGCHSYFQLGGLWQLPCGKWLCSGRGSRYGRRLHF